MGGLKSWPLVAPLLGRHFEVGGRRLALHREGSGGPVVVFLPGAGLVGLDYFNIHTAAARLTTSVIYDRAGTGWSEAIALPRTAAAVAEELSQLLAVADIPPPYVLVGHSLGGAHARRFAQLFPKDVAGLVMLEAAHEGFADMPQPTAWAKLRQVGAFLAVLPRLKSFYRPRFERMLADLPRDLRETLVAYHLRAWSVSLKEAANLQTEVLGEIGAGGDLPDVPMIVLTAMGLDPFMTAFMDEAYLRDLNDGKSDLYAAFARTIPRGEHCLLEDAGHSTIHTDRPDAVVTAIGNVVRAAR